MELISLRISDLNPAPYNPRVALKPGDPAWVKLSRSLEEFSLVQPIVWNRRTGHVVGGHQRLEVMKHQGFEHVDCVVVDLPLEKEKALNVALNNSEIASDWDPDKLVSLIADLQVVPDFDPTLTGFDSQQLKDLLLAPDPVAFPGLTEQAPSDGLIRATLEVPEENWELVEEMLNELLADEPEIRLHVRR